MSALKVLVIGAGNMGAFYSQPGARYRLSHGHAIADNPDLELLGFVDTRPGQAEKASEVWGGSPFADLESALSSLSADIAVVCVPDAEHAPVLNRLLGEKSLRLVFTEKPLADNLADAEAVVRSYAEQSMPLSVNYSRRFIKEFQDCAEAVRGGTYGAFQGGCGYYGKGLFHNGSHLLDQLLFLTGESFSVDHVSGELVDFEESDPSLSAVLKTNNGAIFNLQAMDSRNFSIYEIDLIFERGRIRISDSGKMMELYRVVADAQFADYKSLAGETVAVPLFGCLPAAFENLARHLEEGEDLVSPAGDALEVLSLCQSIRSHL
ncbi:MAG: Gfo/Idh/MocA family protein [Candidatus Obscuribacterales bacterium]